MKITETKLSKWVENTVEKEEIAHYGQFLLSPQCFQKACFPGASKGVIVWEWVQTKIFFQVMNSSFTKQQNVDSSISKAFADDKINEVQLMISVF